MVATRFRVRFEKRDALRFISHLDMMRTFELALRRAGINVAHTQGYNPRPKVSFAQALPLGVESLDEIVDIDVEHMEAEDAAAPTANELVSRLGKELPAGLNLLSAEIASGRPRVAAAEYRSELPKDQEIRSAVAARLVSFMASSHHEFTRLRGGKKPPKRFDARALVLDARLQGSALTMRLATTQAGAMRPSDLLEILGLDPARQPVTKTRTILMEPEDA